MFRLNQNQPWQVDVETNIFWRRISIIKMLVLPLINFLSSMLPLNPPKGFWDRLQSLISEFIWNIKKPRIKFTTLQREKLRILRSWLDPSNSTSWCSLKAKLIHPCRLQDLIYAHTPIKQARILYGPIIENVLVTWKLVTEYYKTNNKWHYHTPIFHNHNWSNNGIHILGKLFDTHGLRIFEDLREQYNLCPIFHIFSSAVPLRPMKFHGTWSSLNMTWQNKCTILLTPEELYQHCISKFWRHPTN